MKLLLDTQIFLWFVADSRKLTGPARSAIAAADEVYVSAGSLWEVAIKSRIGKLEVDVDALVAGIEGCGFSELPVSARHAARVRTLPMLHRDPFDRLLIAQAICEPLHLLTADAALARYSELVMLPR